MAGNNSQGSFFADGFIAPGLPDFRRTITGHDDQGSARFLVRDNGDHRVFRKAKGFDFEAAETSIYNTFETPTDISENKDITAARDDWPVRNSTCIRRSNLTIIGRSPYYQWHTCYNA